jgi:hypothetical protein
MNDADDLAAKIFHFPNSTNFHDKIIESLYNNLFGSSQAVPHLSENHSSAVQTLLYDRLCVIGGINYLYDAFCRCSLIINSFDPSSQNHPTLIKAKEYLAILIKISLLMLQQPHLFPTITTTAAQRQLTNLISTIMNDNANSDLMKNYLDLIFSSVQPNSSCAEALFESIIKELMSDLKSLTFINPHHITPLRVITLFLSIPSVCSSFVGLKNFLHSYMNGYKMETETVLGLLLRFTTLPDDPAVGEKYFNNPLQMTEVERLFCMSRLGSKINKMHEVLATHWSYLLNTNKTTQAALLTWIACVLLSNWSRTKMRPAKKSTSNDGFLLNVASLMINLSQQMNLFDESNLNSIDPYYILFESRLDVKEETKLACSAAEENNFINELQKLIDNYTGNSRIATRTVDSIMNPEILNPADSKEEKEEKELELKSSEATSLSSVNNLPIIKTVPTHDQSKFCPPSRSLQHRLQQYGEKSLAVGRSEYSSLHENNYLLLSNISTHSGIICDKCRIRDFSGVRYKCVNCRDYDLCSSCFTLDSIEALNLAEYSGVTFRCPYTDCSEENVREYQLKQHISISHMTDNSLVACPVCAVNGSEELFIQPKFSHHLQSDHLSDEHNPVNHFFIKIKQNQTHYHKKFFAPQPPFNVIQADSQLTLPPNANASVRYNAVQSFQSCLVHEGWQCSFCAVAPIKGLAYRCYNCPNYVLCNLCESLGFQHHHHAASHLFIKINRLVGKLSEYSASPVFYPPAQLGDFGFNLQTECNEKNFEACEPLANHLPNPLCACAVLCSVGFYLTLHCLHVGLMKTCSRYMALVSNLDGEADSRKVESLIKVKLCVDAQLLNDKFLSQCLNTYINACKYVYHLIQLSNDGDPFNLTTLPIEFAALPEYLVEDLADFILFLARFNIELLENHNALPILHLFVLLLKETRLINNPYLRAKLVEVLCSIAQFQTTHGPGSLKLSAILNTDSLILAHTIPALIRLYIDIENTGSDSQFYDKFNVRHAVAVLIKYLTEASKGHSKQLAHQSHTTELFIRFVNCIINDCIYLLDETFIKAAALHELQEKPSSTSNSASNNSSSNNLFSSFGSRPQRGSSVYNNERIASAGRSLRTASVLAQHTLNLLTVIAQNEESSAVLLRPEMIDRVTQACDTYIDKLAGNKASSIRVKDAASYSYNPSQLLLNFVRIQLAFKHIAHFNESILKLGTEQTLQHFEEAVKLLNNEKLLSATEANQVKSLCEELTRVGSRVADESESLGEIPSEFLDPIVDTLMLDPVILPTSGIAIDRPTILRHLLNQSSDPFNRQPLEAEQLIEAAELRAKIEHFIHSRTHKNCKD